MKHARYSLLFAALSVGLTVVALASYRAISALASVTRDDDKLQWPADTLSTRAAGPVAASYESLAAADEAWRRQYAREYTLEELRVRGDGRRTPRQAMQDRVYRYSRAGDRSRAISELRQWVRSNRRDADAMLWLARLLHEDGRSAEAVPLYRQALAIEYAARSR